MHSIPYIINGLSIYRKAKSGVSFVCLLSCQLNSHPSKPAANVDLYMSNIHGEPGVTVTCVIKTYRTKNAQVPYIHIELCMAPPQVI